MKMVYLEQVTGMNVMPMTQLTVSLIVKRTTNRHCSCAVFYIYPADSDLSHTVGLLQFL